MGEVGAGTTCAAGAAVPGRPRMGRGMFVAEMMGGKLLSPLSLAPTIGAAAGAASIATLLSGGFFAAVPPLKLAGSKFQFVLAGGALFESACCPSSSSPLKKPAAHSVYSPGQPVSRPLPRALVLWHRGVREIGWPMGRLSG